MRLDIATDNPGIELPKIVVSVFPGFPDRAHVTFDIEIISLSCDSVTLSVDDDRATFLGMTRQGDLQSPYENPGEGLAVYLGTKDYGRVGDHIHRDKTGEENHFVVHSDAVLEAMNAKEGWTCHRLRLNPLISSVQVGQLATKRVAIEKTGVTTDVKGKYTLGGWVRIKRPLPLGREQGLMDRVDTVVTLTKLKCGGLYVWTFAPSRYQFEQIDCELQIDGVDQGVQRVTREDVQHPEFIEFPLWEGLANGKEVIRNRDRILCKEKASVAFRARVSSPELRVRARRTSFLLGVGIALCMSIIVQTVWGLLFPDKLGLLIVLMVASFAALIVLLAYGYFNE